MPLTKKGRSILREMTEHYIRKLGEERGRAKAKQVFYASIHAGKIKGAHR